uniref:hypothetical protein n=1 Tax=Klebsiella pneumoniae TaxID=573 RepID=UPI00129EB9D0|nr:hypothetical protein [Klebsiella pneumoniae]
MIKILLNLNDEVVDETSPKELGLKLFYKNDDNLVMHTEYASGLYVSEAEQLQRVFIFDEYDELFQHFIVYSDNWSEELLEYFVRYTLELAGYNGDFSCYMSPDVSVHWDSNSEKFTGWSS